MSASATDRTVNKVALCSAIFAGAAYVGYSVVRQAFGRQLLPPGVQTRSGRRGKNIINNNQQKQQKKRKESHPRHILVHVRMSRVHAGCFSCSEFHPIIFPNPRPLLFVKIIFFFLPKKENANFLVPSEIGRAILKNVGTNVGFFFFSAIVMTIKVRSLIMTNEYLAEFSFLFSLFSFLVFLCRAGFLLLP